MLDVRDENLKTETPKYLCCVIAVCPRFTSLLQADIFVVINHFVILLEDFNSVQLKAELGCDPALGSR